MSPLPNDLPSPKKRRRNHSQTNGTLNNTNTSPDILLKQILGRQPPMTIISSGLNASDVPTPENNSSRSPPISTPLIKTESVNGEDSPAGGQTTGATNKTRSDVFLRVRKQLSTYVRHRRFI